MNQMSAAAASRVVVSTLRLEAIAQTDARTTPMPPSKSGGPTFVGNGLTNYVCGRCGAVICERMRTGQLKGVVFTCGGCGHLNRAP
jgi:predicted RNA-binding Zn-ribbon protein involved in translation (DUF1610 family)